MPTRTHPAPISVLALGVGAFTQGLLHLLKADGARVSTYLTRSYAHYPPSLEGPTFHPETVPDPCSLIEGGHVDFVVPMSIDWVQQPWAAGLMRRKIPIFCPTGEGIKLERDRDFARRLCQAAKIPFPESHLANNRLAAETILKKHPRPFVIKNPICSPTSPIHTIVCETVEDTRSWLAQLDYAEGIFLQEYMGRAEAGHIALVSGGEIYSLVTNQEYKRAFDGNMGIVAGAPLGGLVEQDPGDKYHLARELLHPLKPWFRKVNFHGPVQVTAIRRDNRWHVLEYNVRLGVTSGPLILRLLENPLDTLWKTVRNQPLSPRFRKKTAFGCSLTLAGYGYPYVKMSGPLLPVETTAPFDCDVWWNEVAPDFLGKLQMTGHRIADVAAIGPTVASAISKAYSNIKKIRCVGSYYRTDIGKTLWPPGNE